MNLEIICTGVFPDAMTAVDEAPSSTDNEITALKVSKEQVALFHEIQNQKQYRKQLRFLNVEDQSFSQKLLCEILRGARQPNRSDTPIVEVAEGIHDAWKMYTESPKLGEKMCLTRIR